MCSKVRQAPSVGSPAVSVCPWAVPCTTTASVKTAASPARSSGLLPPVRPAAASQATAPWKHSMAILPVPAMLRLCPFLPLAKISPPQWQRQKTMPCWMHLSPPHRWRWRAIARLTFPLQGTVKLPCAPVAVLLLQNRPPFPLRPLSNRPL